MFANKNIRDKKAEITKTVLKKEASGKKYARTINIGIKNILVR